MDKRNLRLSIPEPCHENWEMMSAAEKGRHCDKCSKTVVDFTGMSDGAITDYFEANTNICGRFQPYQLNRPLSHNNYSLQKFSAVRTGLYAGLMLSLLKSNDVVGQDTGLAMPDTVKKMQIPAPVFCFPWNRSVNGNIIQPNDSNLRVKRMKVSADTFSIEIDLSTTSLFTFTLPVTQRGDSIDVELYTADTVIRFDKIAYAFQSMGTFINSYTRNLVFKMNDAGAWTYLIETHQTMIQPMGIPPPIWGWSQPDWPKIIEWEPVKLITVTTGLTIPLTPEEKRKDSLEQAARDKVFTNMNRTKKLLYESNKKMNDRKLYWWVSIPFIAFAALLGIWLRPRKKKVEAQASEEPEA